MNKKLLILVVAILITPLYVNAEIARTLRIGSRGADVQELQVFLNSDPETRIATSGAGSPGYETTYFGTLTALAVERFQIKHALEVLTPLGLSAPTGVVGPSSRAAIYRIQQNRKLASAPVVSTSTATGITISAISPHIVTSTTQKMTITGTGFTADNNTVTISSEQEGGITGIASADGTTISFPFSFSLAQKMKAQLAPFRSTSNYDSIVESVIQNLSGETIIRSQGVVYVRVILTVKNANGESAPATFLVNIRSLLI